ncbi:MAG: DoxX family protein [Ignavibacteriaceae bacterium]|jgi:Predicted membrane protein|nr:MAG: Inner membrane protein YqjF [Chlorobi bacterium OLB4]MBW7855637.1 DoxX family protein [Ignavibacteria bacterium]MEB2328720.1 DoxX family protein [Ignavibacteriaceae bacterium]OQY79118.1 MAG: hypothetical protein B6D43_00540 [Ignavibacteriales bacterium UTCHB1]
MLKKIIFSSGSPGTHDLALMILRVFFGAFIFIGHGQFKLFGFSEMADKFFDPFGFGPHISLSLATAAEGVCSVLLIIGFLSRPSALLLACTMFVAIFFFHSADPFSVREMALLYFVAFIVLLITGPGKFSIDYLIGKSSNQDKKSVVSSGSEYE